MDEKTLRNQANQYFSNKEYCLAFETILGLEQDDAVRILKSIEWFNNPDFCYSISQNPPLLNNLLSIQRVDEILYSHFNQCLYCTDTSKFKEFHRQIAICNPIIFIKLVRVTQAFLKSPWCKFYFSLELPVRLQPHQKIWEFIHQREMELWRDVETGLTNLVESKITIDAVLVEFVIAIELAYCKNRSTEHIQHLSRVYNVFLPFYLFEYKSKGKWVVPSQQNLVAAFLRRLDSKGNVAPEVDLLMGSIQRWVQFTESFINPYCFDLRIEPFECSGAIGYHQDPMDYYRWKLDGRRYDINRFDFELEGQFQFDTDLKKGLFPINPTWKESNFNYQTKCHIQTRAVECFLHELALDRFPDKTGLDSIRFYHPLVAASNMFKWFHDRIDIQRPIGEEWFHITKEEYKRKPNHLGIDNVPFLYLTSKQLYDAHNGQSVLIGDNKRSADELCQPFTFQVSKSPINRFELLYDVYKKPFFKLDEYLFCPVLFFANNDWFYSFAQTALERLDNEQNSQLRKSTAQSMERRLADAFEACGFESKVYRESEFTNKEMDVDVHISDGQETILLQLKRTKFRLSIKDTYFERINVDNKASRQLNKAHRYLDDKKDIAVYNKKVHKWIVTTSYENLLSKTDDCLKVNYSDLLLLATYFKENKIDSIRQIVDFVESDFKVKNAILNPIYNLSMIDLPLSLDYPSVYLNRILAIDHEANRDHQLFNQAIDAVQRGDRKQAEQLLKECIKEQPNDFEAICELANVLSDNGKHEEAVRFFKKAMVLVPNDPYLIRNFCIALKAANMEELAFALVNKLMEDYWFVDLEL